MNFFNRLERKFGRYAIRDLSRYIVGMYMLGLVVQMVDPSIYYRYLCLNGAALMGGQIWRVITFMMYPLFSLSSRLDFIGVLFNMLIGLTYAVFVIKLQNPMSFISPYKSSLNCAVTLRSAPTCFPSCLRSHL